MKHESLRHLVLFLALAAGPAASDAVDFRRYVAIGGAPTIGPFGIEPSMKGVFEVYSLQPDSSFVLRRDNESNGVRDSGTYRVDGNQILFLGRHGRATGTLYDGGHTLRVGNDAYERVNTGDSVPLPTASNCRQACSQAFVDCSIRGRPDAYCTNQSDACLASCGR